MVDRQRCIFEVKSGGNQDACSDNVDRDDVCNLDGVPPDVFDYAETCEHEEGRSSSQAVDPSGEGLSIAVVYDSRPHQTHRHFSSSPLYHPLAEVLGKGVSVGEAS